MTARERVKRAITFEEPDRVPMLFFNEGKEHSDIVLVDIQEHFTGANRDVSEWGFEWERVDGTMGQPREALIKDWPQLAALKAPAVDAERRIRDAKAAMSAYPEDRYFLASPAAHRLYGDDIPARLRGDAGGPCAGAGTCRNAGGHRVRLRGGADSAWPRRRASTASRFTTTGVRRAA